MIQMANDVHHQHLAWDIIDDPHGTWPPRRRWVKLDAFDYDVERRRHRIAAAATAAASPPTKASWFKARAEVRPHTGSK